MTTKVDHPIWEYIPNKSQHSVYFPSGQYVATKSDCNGIIQTHFYDDIIIGKSIFGYNQPIKQFYDNRGRRFAHSAREPSLHNYGNNGNFITSYQSSFLPCKIDSCEKSDKSVIWNYKHQPFTENRIISNDNLFTCYSTDYFDKGATASSFHRNINKNKMISSGLLQYHLKDPRYNYQQTSTSYGETTNQLGEKRLINYRSSMKPIVPSDITEKRFQNFKRVSGNIILAKLRRTNQPIIN